MNTPEGHRERLRQRFLQNPASISETERLELLLTYAIPRRDVSPIAVNLISRFGSLERVLSASAQELVQIEGIGEAVVTFLHLIRYLVIDMKNSGIENASKSQAPNAQLNLFELGSDPKKSTVIKAESSVRIAVKPRTMRVFANDEIVNTLDLLPKAPQFETLEDFKQFLNEKLPYNAAETRHRRANYFIERYYPEGDLNVPLTYYLAYHNSRADLKPVIFYHLFMAEPIAAKVAEELVWPALPLGRVEREQVREFVLGYLPDAGASSQKNMLRSLFYSYDLLSVGSVNDTILRFQLRSGTLESFLYILTSVFPEPGIYSFEALYSSPVHRWLLWDREWIRRQLYNLQDFGVLTKVSEIDTVRQFSLAVGQQAALRLYFEHPKRTEMAIREKAEDQNASQEG